MPDPHWRRLAAAPFSTPAQAAELMRAAARGAPPDENLLRPRTVALAGAANVGKSALLNALAGYDRALSHEHPGTTRDPVAEWLDVDGFATRVVDLPGFRPDATGLDREAETRAEEELSRADAAALVFALDRPLGDADRFAIARVRAARPGDDPLVILNKSDLPAHLTPKGWPFDGREPLRVSCLCDPDGAARAVRAHLAARFRRADPRPESQRTPTLP